VFSHFTVLVQHGLLAEWQQLTTGITYNCNKSSLKQHVKAMFSHLHGCSHVYTLHITTVTSPAYRVHQDIINGWGTKVKGNKRKVQTAIIWKKNGFNLF
jgi:hypothetical protein